MFNYCSKLAHASSVRIGRLGMPAHHMVENILTGVKAIANRVPQGFRNFQSLHLKTTDSIALPIYNSLPPQPTKLPGVSEAAPVVKKIKLDDGSEGQSEPEEEEEEEEEKEEEEMIEVDNDISLAQKQVELEALARPPSTVKKSKRLKVSDYVDAATKRSTALTPMTAEIRGGVKRKVSSRKLLESGRVRTYSAKKIRGSTVISSQFEKAQRKRRRRTMN